MRTCYNLGKVRTPKSGIITHSKITLFCVFISIPHTLNTIWKIASDSRLRGFALLCLWLIKGGQSLFPVGEFFGLGPGFVEADQALYPVGMLIARLCSAESVVGFSGPSTLR